MTQNLNQAPNQALMHNVLLYANQAGFRPPNSPLNLIKSLTLIGLLLLTMLSYASDKPPQKTQTLLVLGDSLSAGYNIPLASAWPNLLQQQLGDQITIINASISGETSAGGLRRLPAILAQHEVDYFILALGANDGLRGQPLDQLRHNITKMLALAKAEGSQSLLIGIHIPPNYGKRYAQRFFEGFAEVASAQQVAYEPFLLEGVAIYPMLMQEDGLHPTADAQKIIVKTVYQALAPLLAVSP